MRFCHSHGCGPCFMELRCWETGESELDQIMRPALVHQQIPAEGVE